MEATIEGIPQLGFGTWKADEKEMLTCALADAVALGYRLIDTASAYKNEALVGEAIKSCGVPREELFLQGKVWNKDRGYEKTLAAFRRTCEKLGVTYLDAYLIHWPASPLFSPDWEKENAETWRALETLYENGDVRMIGVCNYAPAPLAALKKTANILPMIDQIEFHVGNAAMQQPVLDFCKEEGISVQAWSPLGHGGLLSRPETVSAAEKHKVSPAVLCLAWCLKRGVNPIAKSLSKEHLADNRTALSLTLDDETEQMLSDLIIEEEREL